jgi:hypothetical protein
MGRKSHMSILKRQRELKKAEKAAAKRAKRHGRTEELAPEPVPTLGAAELLGGKPPAEEETPDEPEQDPA